jgi:EAL domain-containing protein (putative c-di-GMP-specific phosphodiesterase class I)
MKNADAAMYHAKERGRNNLQFFTESLNAISAERLALERAHRVALARAGGGAPPHGQLELFYQPQVAATAAPDDAPVAVEALVRWHHPERGLVSPARFIPIAEDTGLILPIGDWVLDEACRRFAEWKAARIGPSRVAVNLSVHQLRDPTLVGKVAAALQRHGLAENELELEITETTAMSDPAEAIVTLQALRDLGVTLAIDDFGTGYSSLAYLKRLPIQVLKLDRDLIRDIETDENDAAISAATLALAESLGLTVVAEGIETEGQRRLLREQGCDLLQGFLFGHPAPAAVWEARWKPRTGTAAAHASDDEVDDPARV